MLNESVMKYVINQCMDDDKFNKNVEDSLYYKERANRCKKIVGPLTVACGVTSLGVILDNDALTICGLPAFLGSAIGFAKYGEYCEQKYNNYTKLIDNQIEKSYLKRLFILESISQGQDYNQTKEVLSKLTPLDYQNRHEEYLNDLEMYSEKTGKDFDFRDFIAEENQIDSNDYDKEI